MRRAPGFTLIEVMIAVAIVAILAAVALPSYSEYVRRARVTDAVSQLSGMRVKMEQHFQDNRSYVGACATTSIAPLPASSPSFTFDCPSANLTASTYLVRALGQGNMSPAVYTLDQANVRATVTPPAGWANGGCGWVLKKDGSC